MARHSAIFCEHCGHPILKHDDECEACGRVTANFKKRMLVYLIGVAAVLCFVVFVRYILLPDVSSKLSPKPVAVGIPSFGGIA